MGGNGTDDRERLAKVIWEQTRRQGLVHLYTGNGKGKTTAALGLALRALGHDRRVAVLQFYKRTRLKTGELLFVEKMDGPITIEQFGASRFATAEEKKMVQESGQTVERGWEKARELVARGEHDLVILDEVTHAVKYGQVSLDSLVRTIDDKAPYLELVITGRYAPPELLDACDYVTEMREIKHPFRDGIRAREGTEY